MLSLIIRLLLSMSYLARGFSCWDLELTLQNSPSPSSSCSYRLSIPPYSRHTDTNSIMRRSEAGTLLYNAAE